MVYKRVTKFMRKKLITAILLAFVSILGFATTTNSESYTAYECSSVGNVSVNVSYGSGKVYVNVSNHNGFAVNVNYKLKAINKTSGIRETIDSGIIYANANKNANGPLISQEGYRSFSVEVISITKCG